MVQIADHPVIRAMEETGMPPLRQGGMPPTRCRGQKEWGPLGAPAPAAAGGERRGDRNDRT